MDCFMKNAHHITWLTSIIYAILRDIRAIRHNLNKITTKILIQALVMSKLDYCNSLLVGLVEYQLDKLQHILNMACRYVCKLFKYNHISGYMPDIQWLQVCECIKCKCAVIMFRNKDNTTPIYIKELLPPKKIFQISQILSIRLHHTYLLQNILGTKFLLCLSRAKHMEFTTSRPLQHPLHEGLQGQTLQRIIC